VQYSVEADSYIETKLTPDAWLEFFSSKGWSEITAILNEWRSGVNIQLRVESGENLYRAQGVAQCIDSLLEIRGVILPKPEKDIEDGPA
jgi:hypothetical protein